MLIISVLQTDGAKLYIAVNLILALSMPIFANINFKWF